MAGRTAGEASARSSRVLDYGCGTGSTSPELLERLGAQMALSASTPRATASTSRAGCTSIRACGSAP